MRRYAGLAGFLILTLGTGLAGGLVTRTSVATWYQALAKPPLTPPDWVFAPVWTALYILMAVAAWRVWLTLPGPGRRIALAVFLLQLALNLGWSIVFFGLQLPNAALAFLAALFLAVLADTILFDRRDRLAAALMLPYLAWLGFAGYLNLGIVRLN
ncbi:TspO/MBR family protein [Desertibaculum subflavum]|uniref:TspO/MBR family protein n=1 Tax=Desertibaculum subflavum TaxID=2268458 RepID=UPI0034D2DF42